MRQRRNSRAITAAVAAASAGLVSAVLALPVAAAEATVYTHDFEDGTPKGWAGRSATATVIDTDGHESSQSLRVTDRSTTEGNAWNGASLDVSTLLDEGTYTIELWVKMVDPAGTAKLNMGMNQPDASNEYPWVGGQLDVTGAAWTQLSGTYTVDPATPPTILYVESNAADLGESFLIDDVKITGEATAPPGTVVVSATTFDAEPDDNADQFGEGGWTQSGTPELTFVDDGNGGKALSIAGRAQGYYSIERSLTAFERDVEHTITMRVRLAEGTVGESNVHLTTAITTDDGDGNPDNDTAYGWVAPTPVTAAAGWVDMTGTFTVPATADSAKIYIEAETPAGQTGLPSLIVDDIVITRPATGVSMAFDFEDGEQGWVARDSQGEPTVAVTDALAHGGEQSLLVSDRTGQGDGAGYDFSTVLEPGQTYDVTAWVRMGEGQPSDDIVLSMQTDDSTFGNLGRADDVTAGAWTQLTATFTHSAAATMAFMYFETPWADGANGTNYPFLIDDISITTHIAEWDSSLTPLKDSVDFPFGVAIDSRETSGAPSELLVHHFDQVTPENYMKPEAWYTGSSVDTFTTHAEATALMDYAAANDLRVYGHTLVWHSQTPAWFFQDTDGRELTNSTADQEIMRERLETHINNVAEALSTGGGYGLFGSDTNPLVAFDVVNEVVADQAAVSTLGLRDSRWYQILGEDFIDLAFQYADTAFNDTYAVADADPVTLFINDYNTEDSGKAQRLLALVERMIERDVPVDGVGHQFHVNLNRSVGDLAQAIDTFADLTGPDGDPIVQAVTELDVTVGTPVTTRALIEQGHYYKAVFDLLRANADEIFSATVWGLTDGRSWRVDSGAPLLFEDDLDAKPAYYGIADVENLPPRQQAANVYRADVEIDDDVITDSVWTDQPLIAVGTDARFQLRWAPDHMTAYVTVDDATVDDTDAVTIRYGLPEGDLATVTVNRDDASSATQRVLSDEDGWSAVVALPLTEPATQGTSLRLDVDVTDGETSVSWNDADGLGTLTFVERSSVVEVVEASTAPTIDGEIDDVWADAQVVSTDKFTQGTAGAQAVARTLWSDDTLYVLMRVSDPVLDDTASNPWEEDSVEIYLDRGNVKNGAYRNELDNQYRINYKNVRSFGSGDETWQDASIESATSIVAGGYVVEVAIDLNGTGGVGTIHGLDVQVNNAAGGARTSIANWADPTGSGYQTTARWGTAKLVADATTVYAPGVTTIEPVRAVSDTQVPRDTEICVPMAGENGVPENATGLILNVTTVNPNGPGFVVAYPGGGEGAPATSTVNFEPGRDVANTTFVGIGEDGTICYRVTGPTKVGVLMDVQGYTTAGSGIVTQEPQRLLDTRPGAVHVGTITGPIEPRTPYTVDVAGEAGVPADATAVIVNATVQGPTAPGNLRIYPAGGDVPNASVLNFAPGREKANTTIVQLPESGEIAFYADTPGTKAASPVHVILDVVGYMTASTTYTSVTPERVIDTRGTTGPLVGALQARRVYPVQIADLGPVPAGATSVMLNVTAVDTTLGNLRVFPDPSGNGTSPVPGASSINYIEGRAIPNLVVVDVPMSGTIAFYSDQPGGTVHLVVDVVGYVAPAPTPATEQPGPWQIPDGFVPGGATTPVATQVNAARGTGNVAALTFDDGPMYAADTNELLDYLEAEDIQAVFCVIGDNIEADGGAELLQRMVADGHTLCNHGTSYADMGSWTANRIAADLMENLEIIRTALGDPDATVPYFRAPNGSWGEAGRTEAVAVALGMQPLGLGNVISDWEDAVQADVEALKTNLRAAITPGAVVLAHVGGGSSRANTMDAVQAVVAERLADGWTFTLPAGGVEPSAPAGPTGAPGSMVAR